MKTTPLLTVPLLALALVACGDDDKGDAGEEPVETEVEVLGEFPCTGSDCEGRLPLLLAAPEEFDHGHYKECEDYESLWQITDDPDDPPVCDTRGGAFRLMEEAEGEPVETESPTTVATTTTTTEPPPPPTREASAPLDNTTWYAVGGFVGLEEGEQTFTLLDTGEVDTGYECTALSGADEDAFCLSWEQDGKEVKIELHFVGSGGTIYTAEVGPGNIMVGSAFNPSAVRSSDPLDNLGQPLPGLEPIMWNWGAVWCPDRDCPEEAEEVLSQHVDLSVGR